MYTLYLLALPLLTASFLANGMSDSDPRPFDVEHYVFNMTIHDHTDKILGKAHILARLEQDNINEIELDLVNQSESGNGRGMKVSQVSKDGRKLGFSQQDNKLKIFLHENTQAGQIIELAIHYEGIPIDGLVIGRNKYGDRTFFGDNWPDRARHWLPTVDHPADKATCEFVITSPVHYQVVANGSLREESNVKVGLSDQELKITHWVSKVPIPTKVMVFGAARFAVLHADHLGNIPVEYWVYPEDKETGFVQFEPTLGILDFFHQQISPYPYQKLANVQSKTNYGGMENASNVFYNENAINNSSIESLIAHELAHQWFGNSVTEADWPHLWLSEGFATYFTHLYMEHAYGRDSMQARLRDDKEPVFAYHQKSPEAAVIDTTSSNLSKLINANSYQKGSWFLHMLRYKLGDELFFQGIREYYQKFQHTNAETDDFRMVMEQVSGKDLRQFFRQWLQHPGYPYLLGHWKYQGFGKKLSIELEQAQQHGLLYELDVQIAIYYKNVTEPEIHTLRVNKDSQTLELKLKKAPSRVVLDPDTWILMDYRFEER